MTAEKLPKSLTPFRIHGVVFHGMSGNNWYGDDPWSGKPGKFYVNPRSGLWDIKHTGEKGNLQQFLDRVAYTNMASIDRKAKLKLSKERGLPWEAFEPWRVGFNGLHYTIPVLNDKGRVVDIRWWKLGKQVKSTCQTGLLGANFLADSEEDVPVYICEGESDTAALMWLLQINNADGVVVGLPGANTFKDSWVPWFNGREVFCCLDNDAAGEEGELRINRKLTAVASSLRFVHWPAGVRSGFDVRDWVRYGVLTKRTPKRCLSSLQALSEPFPRRRAEENGDSAGEDGQEATREEGRERKDPDSPASFADVSAAFHKWLYLRDTHAVEISLAVVLSNQIGGDPVWLFLVAPPGGSKTETLNSLSGDPDVYEVSSLTPKTLISGAVSRNGTDPSLLPRLNMKTLVVKDLTALLTQRDQDRDEIFGVLRDSYDGRCSKEFGNGIRRTYHSRFSILAAVTPKIYELSSVQQQLGERFLKFCVGHNLRHAHEEQIVARAIQNVTSETTMREELRDVVHRFLSSHQLDPDNKSLPSIPENMLRKIIALARFGARMRGTVSRDRFRSDILITKPSAEVGSRLGKQLAKIGMALALVHDSPVLTDRHYLLLRKIVLDTISQREEECVKWLYLNCQHEDDEVSTINLAAELRFPVATVTRMLADLNILEVVDRRGKSNAHRWRLSEYILEQMRIAELYTSDLEINREKFDETIRKIRPKDTGKPRRGRPPKVLVRKVKQTADGQVAV